ncbi:MAG: tRNA (adenosine(37)-N6)-threonylcarbamoyltransferase complex transferase subunit TsaD [Thermoanaerobaculales bacterium]|jgi:N6-L-threonylcarbamoyladenine synthase|nr:tRNA (adenosine(37)-N6)-threonylcarbamoyltransferase complex transferase subunit TsaD [Thermoanaerobaculales bacterium]
MSGPRTLAVETSCDETAVAVLDGDGRVEANLLASQIAAHAPYGGVVPELASREHLGSLPRLVEGALGAARGEIGLVAVTAGPGLLGALLVGVRFASAFAWARGLPLVAVDHLHGHLASPFLDLDGGAARAMPSRVLALVASGGHSSWYLCLDGEPRRLSRTRDDAAGESLDKVAQVLGLPYPGGPVVDRLARLGDPGAVDLPRPRLADSALDVSFSGLKSAAIRFVRAHRLEGVGEDDPPMLALDLLASFERAVVDQLLAPAAELVAEHRPDLIAASGGVAANTLLRRRLGLVGEATGVEVLLPPLALTTDNAAMIGRAGQLDHARGRSADPRRLDAHARRAWQPPGMRKLPSPGGVR